MIVARTRREAQAWSAAQAAQGRRVAFAPTMGALHAGHVSLIGVGAARADVVASSIFVNPTQFAAGEDFATYPRDEARDLDMLAAAGCALAYCPEADEIYPPGDATRVRIEGLSAMLEGEPRPHFFEGVATVVSRLFVHVRPQIAVFGEKDFQQLAVIRRMTLDFGFDIEIVGAPIARDADGLALSSRNAYLTAQERAIAPRLHAELQATAAEIAAGAEPGAAAMACAARLARQFAAVDYVEARRADTLAPLAADDQRVDGRLLAAVRLGRTRLIDNLALPRRADVTTPALP
jgi:pantoate--beta-alanine ligase